MAQQYNGDLAVQSNHFRGVSTFQITPGQIPNFKAIRAAVYTVSLVGGVSGNYNASVYGYVGSILYPIAGLSSLTTVAVAPGRIMTPLTYEPTGNLSATELVVGASQQAMTLVDRVPPAEVRIASTSATAGISAHVVVGAVIRGD
jgi:hypothetical protein